MFSDPQKGHAALINYIVFTKALFLTLPCQPSGLTFLLLRATPDLPAHYYTLTALPRPPRRQKVLLTAPALPLWPHTQ